MVENRSQQNEFERIRNTGRPNVVAEFWAFLRLRKKWWMLPILITMLALGVLVFLSSTPVAPFIYTLF